MRWPQDIVDKITFLGNSLSISKVDVSMRVIYTPKRRPIVIPNEYLKEKQKELYRLLIAAKIPKFVFSKKGSFYANKARFHLGDDYLINVDIKDFYPSINFRRISKLFNDIGIIGSSANENLTYCTTFSRSLPQGFVTSPILSNLVVAQIDKDLYRYCRMRDIRYSRYVDDLTFSGKKKFEASFLTKVARIVHGDGFKLNNKTQIYGLSDVKFVLGLRLGDDEISISDEYLQRVDQDIEELKILIAKNGDFLDAKSSVKGELQFVKQINVPTYEELVNRHDLSSII